MWKPISSLQGKYSASNYGNIKRNKRTDATGHVWEEKLLKQRHDRNGYASVHISIDGKSILLAVHRAVAECFCVKPDGCNIVNHIDNNPSNNTAENLEWTTYTGNMQHALKQGRMKGHLYIGKASKVAHEMKKIPVFAIDKDGNKIEFRSQTDAAEALGIGRGHIAAACRKEYGYKKVGGYEFEYVDESNKRPPQKIGMSKQEQAELSRKRMLGNQHSKGIPCSEEAKRRSKEVLGHKVCQYDMQGNLIREFQSVNEVKKEYGYSVEYAVKKKKDHVCHGFVWRLKDE